VDNLGNIVEYEYDTLNRLTKEINGDNITAYSYDLAGNRTAKVSAVIEGDVVRTDGSVSYTLGSGNRLSSWGTNGVARYDLAGCLTNMVSDIDGKELNLGWNSQYQLSTVDVGGGTNVSYDYNVLGQRISRKEIIGSDLSADRQANTEYYVHDGVNIVADLDENKELLRNYTYAPGYDNIISMTTYGETETNTYFYIRNHNNSVVALIDESGSIAESYTYTAYGEVSVFDANGAEIDESALGNRYTFQGRELDYTTGLYNFRARWYDAETGRWLSKDPIGINGGLNQYVFCGNNPVMFVDPEGCFSWITIGIIGAALFILKYYFFSDRADTMREKTKHQKKRFDELQDKIDRQVEDGEYNIPLDIYNRDAYNETADAVGDMEEVMPPGTSLTGPANMPTSPADVIGSGITKGIELINDIGDDEKEK